MVDALLEQIVIYRIVIKLCNDVIIFVCGKKSSNGKVLYNQCLSVNPRTYMVDDPSEINLQWFEGATSAGICGATSTPKWLMEDCKKRIEDEKA